MFRTLLLSYDRYCNNAVNIKYLTEQGGLVLLSNNFVSAYRIATLSSSSSSQISVWTRDLSQFYQKYWFSIVQFNLVYLNCLSKMWTMTMTWCRGVWEVSINVTTAWAWHWIINCSHLITSEIFLQIVARLQMPAKQILVIIQTFSIIPASCSREFYTFLKRKFIPTNNSPPHSSRSLQWTSSDLPELTLEDAAAATWWWRSMNIERRDDKMCILCSLHPCISNKGSN